MPSRYERGAPAQSASQRDRWPSVSPLTVTVTPARAQVHASKGQSADDAAVWACLESVEHTGDARQPWRVTWRPGCAARPTAPLHGLLQVVLRTTAGPLPEGAANQPMLGGRDLLNGLVMEMEALGWCVSGSGGEDQASQPAHSCCARVTISLLPLDNARSFGRQQYLLAADDALMWKLAELVVGGTVLIDRARTSVFPFPTGPPPPPSQPLHPHPAYARLPCWPTFYNANYGYIVYDTLMDSLWR